MMTKKVEFAKKIPVTEAAPNAWCAWSREGDRKLMSDWAHGFTVPQLAERYGRSYNAIVLRLTRNFGSDYYIASPIYKRVKMLEAKLKRIMVLK